MLDVIEHPGRIRELRLSRPPVNALDGAMLQALIAGFEGASGEAAVVVTGAPGLFSAGLDVPSLLKLDRPGLVTLFTDLWRVQRVVACSPVPVIFGLTGHCPAGGTVLAIHGDYRVMAQGDFRLGLNEVQVGLFPGPPIFSAFQRLVGGHAAQFLTRGALLDPATALRVGLVDELCEPTQVAARALEMARELSALPREAMLKTRAMVRADLVALFGDPADAARNAATFAATGSETWFSAETQERLRMLFRKKDSTAR